MATAVLAQRTIKLILRMREQVGRQSIQLTVFLVVLDAPADSVLTASTLISLLPTFPPLRQEIDNVSSINKGWDVGAGVGWNLTYPYTANGSVPATGVRSSVPLGGMGTGNFEVRADGTFRQWCIESQSPGGAAKLDIGALDEAILAVRTQVVGSSAAAATLRVNPPSNLPGVAAIQYQGAVPVSKLTVLDTKFPKGMAVYAHGEMLPFDVSMLRK